MLNTFDKNYPVSKNYWWFLLTQCSKINVFLRQRLWYKIYFHFPGKSRDSVKSRAREKKDVMDLLKDQCFLLNNTILGLLYITNYFWMNLFTKLALHGLWNIFLCLIRGLYVFVIHK